MHPFLVSFTVLGAESRGTPGSHVLTLPKAPESPSEIVSLTNQIKEIYGGDVFLLGWCLLPNQQTHPAGEEPYTYFISCQVLFTNGRAGVLSAGRFSMGTPILTLRDVRDAEAWLRQQNPGYQSVRLLNCIPLKS